MKPIQAICSDIDGTLLDALRGISPRLKQAIQQLPTDFPVILASSRMPSAMRYLQYDLGRLGCPMICYNGGYVIHEQDQTVVLNDIVINLDVCKQLLAVVKNTEVHMSLYHADSWYAPTWDIWTEREIRNTRVVPHYVSNAEVFKLWEEEKKGAHKVMCMGKAEEIEYVYQEALRLGLGDLIHLYRSKDTYIEIAPKEISKASALELLLKERYDFGLDAVMSFGDNYNDIDLLEKSGWGVAVDNAREEVKQIANEVTLHHKEDGVAVMIEKYCL